MSSISNVHILALQYAGGVLSGKTLLPRFITCSRPFLHSSIVPLLMDFSSSSTTSSCSAENFFLRSDQDSLLRLFAQSSTLQFSSKLTFDSSSPQLIEEILVDKLMNESRYSARGVTSLRLSAVSNTIIEALAKMPFLTNLNMSGAASLYDRGLLSLANALRSSGRIRKLNLAHNNVIGFNGVKHLVAFAPTLRSLNLESCMKVSSSCIRAYVEVPEPSATAQKNNNKTQKNNFVLRELNLNCTAVATLEFLPFLRNLVSLQLASCPALVGADLKHFARCVASSASNDSEESVEPDSRADQNVASPQCVQQQEEPNPLQELNLSANRHLVDADIALLKLPLPYLNVLNLSLCPRLTDSVISDTLSQATFATSLRVLSLCGNNNLTNRGIDALGALTALQVLQLSGITKLTKIDFAGKLKELRTLNLAQCEQLADISGLEHLHMYRSLQSLSLHSCCGVVDEQLQYLRHLCISGLEKLDLSMCSRVSQAGVQFLVDEVTGADAPCTLKELSLASCRRVNQLTTMLFMTNLEKINVSATLVTAEHAKVFKIVRPLVRLIF